MKMSKQNKLKATSIFIDPILWKKAKIKAIEEGKPVHVLVEEALRKCL